VVALEKKAWQQRVSQLGADWIAAAQSGATADGDEAQALAQRHFEWLRSIPGTPGGGAAGPSYEYLTGLGEMYVADDRFAANYGGTDGAEFVRDALRVYADRHLKPGG
jgi:hypothetical protein